MIRRILRLAVDAAKVELSRLVESAAPAPAPVPVPQRSPWESPAYHLEQLANLVCCCGEAKEHGSYRCKRCAATQRQGTENTGEKA